MNDERLNRLKAVSRNGCTHARLLKEAITEIERLKAALTPSHTPLPIAWIYRQRSGLHWTSRIKPEHTGSDWFSKAAASGVSAIYVDTLDLDQCRPIHVGEPLEKPKPPQPLPVPVYRDDVLTVYRMNDRRAIVKPWLGGTELWELDYCRSDKEDAWCNTRAEAERVAATWVRDGESNNE